MYLYNTTFVVFNNEIAWWKEWMSRYYMPTFYDVIANVRIELYKLENNAQDTETTSYSCQIRCDSLKDLGDVDRYVKSLLQELSQAKGDKCLYFSTMMKQEKL